MSNNNVNPESIAQLIYITPHDVASDLTLSAHDLRIYMIISSFTYTRGNAYVSNDYLAKRLNIDRSTVIRSINRLCKKQYIIREEIKGQRYLKIFTGAMVERCDGGVAAVRRRGRTRATQGSQGCDPINNKIINKNINKKSKRSACFTNKSVDNFLKPKPKLKYLTQEERLENEKHIRAREEKARMEKEEEIKPFRRNGEITVLGNLFKGF